MRDTKNVKPNPTHLFLIPGPACDLQEADVLLPQLQAGASLADKAYDASQPVILPLAQRGIVPVIPPKTNRLARSGGRNCRPRN